MIPNVGALSEATMSDERALVACEDAFDAALARGASMGEALGNDGAVCGGRRSRLSETLGWGLGVSSIMVVGKVSGRRAGAMAGAGRGRRARASESWW